MTTEFSWVIESGNGPQLIYWDGGQFSYLHARAIRFSRRVDAERVMVNLPSDMRPTGMKVAEHGWMDGKQE